MRQVSSTLSSRAKYWWSPTIAAQQHLVWLRRLAELAGERGVQVDGAPGLSAQGGQLQPQARVRIDSQDDLVRLCPGRLGKQGQPGRAAREQPHLGDLAR
jgi:hypothetical protein